MTLTELPRETLTETHLPLPDEKVCVTTDKYKVYLCWNG